MFLFKIVTSFTVCEIYVLECFLSTSASNNKEFQKSNKFLLFHQSK